MKKWYDYLWIASATYLFLGLFHILFAWLGLICFITPLLISVLTGNKRYCHRYCGRGQLFQLLGNKYKLSRYKNMPNFLRSSRFRYGFLIFFLTMFMNMLFVTVKVAMQMNDLKQVVTLFWTWKVPWHTLFTGVNVPAWVSQFSYGFYSVMLTSTLLGIITMYLYKPRSWCVFCPMGTMTQMICKLKNK